MSISKDKSQDIANKSPEIWDQGWEHISNGFTELQSSLRWVPGLFAAKQGSRIVYIGAATQKQSGLRAGLGRARLPNQTGNSSQGLQ